MFPSRIDKLLARLATKKFSEGALVRTFCLRFVIRWVTKGGWALDKVIAMLVLCVGMGFTAWSISVENHKGTTIAGILLAAALFYLLFRRRLSGGENLSQFQLGNRFRLLNHVVFTVCLSLSVLLLCNNLYYRPPLYFALCLVAVAAIILDILSLNEAKSSNALVALFKIIALSLAIYAGIYYQFPGIYGVDPWLHTEWIQETIDLGGITQGQFVYNSYFLFPVFHLAGAMTKIMTGLSIHNAVFATVGVIVALTCLFIFLIGRKLVNTKVGLLAALIVPLTANAIERATAIIPMSLGFCFFLAILYLVFCREKKRVSETLLVMILSAALVLTHTIAALAALVGLIAVFIGIKFHKQITKPVIAHELVSLILIALFGVAMLTRWMQAPARAPPFFDWGVGELVSSFRLETQFMLTGSPTATNVSHAVWILNEGGYLLLLLFGIVGALLFLHSKNRTASRAALVLTAAVLIVLPYSFQLLSVETILPWRWFLFIYVPLSILAVCGLSAISNLIRGGIGKLGMVIVVMLAVMFMMTTNSVANDDSPQVFNGAERFGYTQSELTAIETLSDIGWGCPETDIYYGYIFPYVIGYDEYVDMVQRNNEVFIQRNYYLHHPEWDDRYVTRIHHGGIGNYEPEGVLISDYMKEYGIDKSPLIYNNGNVKTYAISGVE